MSHPTVFRTQQEELARHLVSRDERVLFPLRLNRLDVGDYWHARVARDTGNATLAANSFLAEASRVPIVITGDPGSGKTTLLESWALQAIRDGKPTFFLRMGLWDKRGDLVEQLGGPITVDRVEWDGAPMVFFDALDEAPDQAIDEAFQVISKFVSTYPRCEVVCSCRVTELPAWAADRFSAARLLPLTEEQVDEALRTAMEGGNLPLHTEVVSDLRNSCKNPLMLSMTQELLLSGDSLVLDITSSSQLYDYFIELIDKREWGKRPPDQAERQLRGGLNLRLLAAIAWRLTAAQRTAVDETEFGNWLAEELADSQMSPWWGDGNRPSVPWLVRMLGSRAPLKPLASPVGGMPRFSFMHLTFRDALAARHLRSLCRANNPETLIGALAEEQAPGLALVSEKYWTVISLYAGSEESAGSTTRLLMRRALAGRNQDILRLACMSIAMRWDIKAADVEDLLLIVLDAFKTWDRDFDYDLMRAGQGLAERLGADYPARLRSDLQYFVNKYAANVPRLLSPEIPADQVFALARSRASDVVADVVFTLARRAIVGTVPRRRAAEAIMGLLGADCPNVVSEQAIAALKDIADPISLDLVRDIVRRRRFSERAIAFAVNAIAEMGDPSDVTIIAELLLDHDFGYRDSAAWSLQKLARRLEGQFPELRENILTIYVTALKSETRDGQGVHAKGTILYSLGMLGAIEYVHDIEDAVEWESAAYVREDGLLALARAGRPESIPLIRRFLADDDPAVRLKAAEALQRLNALTANDRELLTRDRYLIIRDFADRSALSDDDHFTRIARVAGAALSRPPVNLRESRVDFRITADEKTALEEVCQVYLRAGVLGVMPEFLDGGAEHEVRFAPSDVEPLRIKIAERAGLCLTLVSSRCWVRCIRA